MSIPRARTASITAAGVVAIIGSVLVLLGAALGLIGILIIAPVSGTGPAVPRFTKFIAEGTIAFILALGILGVFTGVGLLRLRNWARISTLVWSGVTVAMCAFVLVIMVIAPFPAPPNAPTNLAGFVRATVLIFYGIPLAIGTWWLILFNKKSVTDQFDQSADRPLDASGFPEEPISTSKSALPLPVTVLAVFLVISSLSVIVPFFIPVPVILFGHALRGGAGTAVWDGACLLSAAAGIGLLRLKSWSYPVALGLQMFWLLSGAVTLASGSYPALMREVMSSMKVRLGVSYSEYSVQQMRSFSVIGLAAPVLILAFLVYYRSRFINASASKR